MIFLVLKQLACALQNCEKVGVANAGGQREGVGTGGEGKKLG